MTEEETFKRLAGPANIKEAADIFNAACKKAMEQPGITPDEIQVYADKELRKYGWSKEMLDDRRYNRDYF